MTATTGIVWTPHYLGHDPGPDHPEQPERLARLEAILAQTAGSPVSRILTPQADGVTSILRVHETSYVERFHRACAQGARVIDSPECPVCSDSFSIALLAAGGAVTAVDAVMARAVRNAFCAVRPPGHHAERGLAMGFCYFNNTAIAVEHLRSRYGLERIVIVDWDVHHGNGTQHIFEEDADVLLCDIHQHPDTLFPGTGYEWEKGTGRGVGATLNVVMMPGAGDADYRWAFEHRIAPAVDAFEPEFVIVSAGFDAHREDPLADIELTTGMFAWMTDQVLDLAESHCQGRLVSILEGGYNPQVLTECIRVHVEALAAVTSSC